MRVDVIHCGPFANESEQQAVEGLKTRLISELGDGQWLLLTNLAFSASHHRQSDEIDIIVIGPPGVRVVEVKHWTSNWVRRNPDLVDREADKVTDKAKKIGTTLREKFADVGRVDSVFLVTQTATKVRQIDGREVRGVPFRTIQSWQQVVGLNRSSSLTDHQVRRLGQTLWPKASVALDGTLRAFRDYTALALQSPRERRFHRSYKGVHAKRRNAVTLHLYDTSASDEPNPEVKARREFDALRRLQLHAWAPRVEDSFQEAPGYAGEMWFFTVSDPAAPTIEERAVDDTWHPDGRLAFARRTVSALADLHSALADLHGSGEQEEPMLHRNLTPSTILVKHDNTPILTGFEYARIPADQTVAVSASQQDGNDFMAPEVRTQGIGAADVRSDTYSLCASLSVMFDRLSDDVSNEAKTALELGMDDDPANRITLDELEDMLAQQLGESPSPPPDPPARFWTEDQVIRFRGRDYRIVARVGSGGVGTAFKVVGVDRESGEDLGAYVAKVVHDKETGNRVLPTYDLVRSHLRHSALSTIFETADEWRENDIVALMTWIEGEPLSDLAGVLPIYAGDLQEDSGEALALRWLRTLCEALDVLHRNGLVHGDVSPRNMIVAGSDIVLTDYDCVTKVGDGRVAPGTVLYSSYSHIENATATPADDLFALAASFFHVLFDREPFSYSGTLAKERGLNWANVAEREDYPTVAAFMDRATHADPDRRLASTHEARAMLIPPRADGGEGSSDQAVGVEDDTHLSESPRGANKVPWLRSLLQSYPGSQWGNSETRGLDTAFAEGTYVETPLEASLLEQIRERKASLVILCGNAGDGKTALLQHLARRLGLGHEKSETRILEGRTVDGLTVRINLDGSASWRGQSADDLVDEFLAPFQHGPPSEDIAHLLAVNDGRLLEWIERREGDGGTPLTRALTSLLDEDGGDPPAHIQFINLNRRSLVGGVTTEGRIETKFLDKLIESLYGGKDARQTWEPCRTCSAEERCEVRRAMKWFGPSELHDSRPTEQRSHAHKRLFDALQAVHLRGETHITVRELRASLVYILFGTHYCTDYHSPDDDKEDRPQPYWDRAFAPDSVARQGEVLGELIRFDPALEAHPKVDRFLSRNLQDGETLGAARRRAYFEMPEKRIETVAEPDALGMARGQHMAQFRDLSIRPNTREDLCRRLCRGISRLEDLPPQALDREGVVPLRITPRTPTETAFWVEKKLGDFRLAADPPTGPDGQERLHREAHLVYRYRDGQEERLRLGADLFHVLLELAAGYQLGDASTDDTFAQLAIFVQRLVREDERRVLAWNPMKDEAIYEISARIIAAETPDALQQLHLQRLEE